MKRLREIRKQKGKNQQEVADFIDVDRTTYSNYETGKRDPDTETLSKMALFFDVSTDYLLGITDDPTPPSKKKPTPETVGPILTDVLKKAGYLKDGKPLTDAEADQLLKYLAALHEVNSKGN